jgi:hypothetical protein
LQVNPGQDRISVTAVDRTARKGIQGRTKRTGRSEHEQDIGDRSV